MSETTHPEGGTGVQIDWADLEQALRRAGEAVRTTPRFLPAALKAALTALRTARESLGTGSPDIARGLADIEASVKAASERIVHADRWIAGAREHLTSLRSRATSS